MALQAVLLCEGVNTGRAQVAIRTLLAETKVA